MSSPMFPLPEHFPINVNASREGPVVPIESAEIVCWCSDLDCLVPFTDVNHKPGDGFLAPGQVWVWARRANPPRWMVRATGALL